MILVSRLILISGQGVRFLIEGILYSILAIVVGALVTNRIVEPIWWQTTLNILAFMLLGVAVYIFYFVIIREGIAPVAKKGKKLGLPVFLIFLSYGFFIWMIFFSGIDWLSSLFE